MQAIPEVLKHFEEFILMPEGWICLTEVTERSGLSGHRKLFSCLFYFMLCVEADVDGTQQHTCVWQLRMDTLESQEKMPSQDASQLSAADLYVLKNTSQSINSHIIRNLTKKYKLN